MPQCFQEMQELRTVLGLPSSNKGAWRLRAAGPFLPEPHVLEAAPGEGIHQVPSLGCLFAKSVIY